MVLQASEVTRVHDGRPDVARLRHHLWEARVGVLKRHLQFYQRHRFPLAQFDVGEGTTSVEGEVGGGTTTGVGVERGCISMVDGEEGGGTTTVLQLVRRRRLFHSKVVAEIPRKVARRDKTV